MPVVVFTRLAEADMDEIWDYLSKAASAEVADNFVEKLEEKCRMLSRMPKAFRRRPELVQNIRSYPYKRYLIFYREIDKGIQIVRILHSARNIAALLGH